jgi:anti-sigma factor RsiW
MQCERARKLIGAAIDAELGDDDRASVTRHIEGCAACMALTKDIERTSKAVGELGRRPAPAGLAARIRAGLAAEEPDGAPGWLSGWGVRPGAWRQVAALAVCSVVSVLLTWGTMTYSFQAANLKREIITAYVSSLLQDSPIQVVSSDSHTVKPWFAGRVDFSHEVRDLAGQGFSLAGGRLDYVHERRVGVLVYRRRLHIINVFMWRAPGAEDVTPSASAMNGYNFLTWTRGGVSYWAVSDLDGAELRRLQQLL